MALQAKVIKQKIGSVKNIRKITRAMEMVSANKMRKAILAVTDSKAYVKHAYELLQSLKHDPALKHPFLNTPEKATKTLLIGISSNKGLCGGYNTNIRKKVSQYVKNNPGEYTFIAIGKHIEKTMKRLDGTLRASFVEFGETVHEEDMWTLNEIIKNEWETGQYKNAFIFYTEFISSLSYVIKERHILPIRQNDIEHLMDELKIDRHTSIENFEEYLYEPSHQGTLDFLLPRITEIFMYQSMLEASASEHSSRMVAMKNASDNAKKLVDNLTVGYNRARQAMITQEIAEISAGSMM